MIILFASNLTVAPLAKRIWIILNSGPYIVDIPFFTTKEEQSDHNKSGSFFFEIPFSSIIIGEFHKNKSEKTNTMKSATQTKHITANGIAIDGHLRKKVNGIIEVGIKTSVMMCITATEGYGMCFFISFFLAKTH